MLKHSRPPLALFGHPGHELSCLTILSGAEARCCYLTDGSGSSGQSRLPQTRALLARHGLQIEDAFQPLPEPEIIQALLRNNGEILVSRRRNLTRMITAMKPAYVLTDFAEGYNPVHDLCHFMLREACRRARFQGPVYEVALSQPPTRTAARPSVVETRLTAIQLRKKRKAIDDYRKSADAGLRREIDDMFRRHGHVWLNRERLNPVPPPADYRMRISARTPAFEKFGAKRVESGKYDTVLTYRAHLRPALAAIRSG